MIQSISSFLSSLLHFYWSLVVFLDIFSTDHGERQQLEQQALFCPHRQGRNCLRQDLKIGSNRGMRDLEIYLILNKQPSFPAATVRLYHLCGLVIEHYIYANWHYIWTICLLTSCFEESDTTGKNFITAFLEEEDDCLIANNFTACSKAITILGLHDKLERCSWFDFDSVVWS